MNLRVGGGTFPIPSGGAAPHAEVMDTTTASTATAPDDHSADHHGTGDHRSSDYRAGDHRSSDFWAGDHEAGEQSWQQPLRRPMEDRMVAGVAAGIARHLGVEAAIVRIVLVVLTFAGGAGVPLYLAGWLLIPDEGAELSIASDFLARPGHSR